MTTYVYETIPSKSGGKPKYFEFKQSMSAAPYTKHPETGQPIRRVMMGGFGVLSSKPESKAPSRSKHSCGTGCGCH